MYATNAFALKRVIRELLIETLLIERGFGFEYEINGEKVDNLESWMLDVENMVKKVSHNMQDVQNQVEVRDELIKDSRKE